MKLLLASLLFLSINGFGQLKDYTIGPRGDTLNRLDLKGRKQGPWTLHVDDLRGERGYEEEGYFENGNKEGTWKKFSLEGVKIAEENYRWGKLNGPQKYFTYNGGLLREESWRALDPSKAYDTAEVYDIIDPSKVVGHVIVKNEGVAMKNGVWKYYDPEEGTITKTEKYAMDKLQDGNGNLVGDDDLKPINVGNNKAKSDTTKVAKPKEVMDYEKKNAGKKKVRTRDGQTGY